MNKHDPDFENSWPTMSPSMRMHSCSAVWPPCSYGTIRERRWQSSADGYVGWRGLRARRSTGADDEAKGLYERALAAWEKVFGSNHPHVAYLLMGLAEVALEQRRPFDALPLAQRAVAVWENGGVPPDELAEARFVLAQALWDAPVGGGRDRARAISLAEQARGSFCDEGAGTARELAEVEQWIREHGQPG
jgi:hypothetical protein